MSVTSFAGSTPLQQFAKLGLSLTIGDFRQMCEEINGLLPHTAALDDAEVVEVLFSWMTRKIEEKAPAQPAQMTVVRGSDPSPVLGMLEEK